MAGNAGTTARSPGKPGSFDAERQALAALYQYTGGPAWRNNEGWLSSPDLGEWYGVITDPDGHVIGLDLFQNNLAGEIPPQLGLLANLQALAISGNRALGGEIPAELGDLSNLIALDLVGNTLTGAIPPELGRLANLEVLDLSRNELTGILPPELGALVKLRELILDHNHLTGEIPPELEDLVNLRRMNLTANQLSGRIPPELGRLGNLVELNLATNRLSGEIPPELGNLTWVKELKLSGNLLSGEIPAELGDLSWLAELGLDGNALSGCIPDSLRIYHHLAEQLRLQFCAPPAVAAADAGGDKADFIGPSIGYIDPVLVALLYKHASGGAPSATVRLGIGHDTRMSVETPLDTYIEESGGTPDGEYIWLMPISLVPSVICRPDVMEVELMNPDGTPGSEGREKPYHNMDAVLIDAVRAHQGGMPENQAALYALGVWGNSVFVHVQVGEAGTRDSILDWLSQHKIYVHPNAAFSDDLHHVVVLLPVSRILPLAQQFPDAYLDATDIRGEGVPMLRSQWPLEALQFERAVTGQYIAPESDAGYPGPGQGIMPCSSGTGGR